MTQFHAVFSLGYEQDRLSSTLKPEFRQTSLAQRIRPEDRSLFAALLGEFARSHLGMALVDRFDRKEIALATTLYPQRPHESIDWSRPLFDSDGFEHSLVHLGGVEVVTKHSFTYCVWDRRTGQCLREGASDLSLSNQAMTPAQREQRARDMDMAIVAPDRSGRQRPG